MLDTVIQLIINGLLLGGIYALLSIGLTLIFGVLEVVNFAHGEFLMISMYLTFWLFHAWGIDPYVCLLIIIPVFFIFGLAVQQVIIKPLLNAPPINQIFATIGLSLVFQNLALLLFKADFRTVKTSYSNANLLFGEIIISVPRLIAFVVAIGIIAVLFLFLKKTFTGKAIRALAQQRKAAMLMGINVYRTYAIAFGIGIALCRRRRSDFDASFLRFPHGGVALRADRVCGRDSGGYNSLGGSLSCRPGHRSHRGVPDGFFISPHLKEVVYFVIFIFILLFRPTGLFGRR